MTQAALPHTAPLQAIIDALFSAGSLPVSASSVERARAVADSFVPPLEDADAWRVGEISIPGDPAIPALTVRPSEASRAVMVYFHGGGWVIGSPRNYAPFAIRLADATGCTIILPQYRLAPETRFPGAVQDALRALQWLDEAGMAELGLTGPLIVAGDSAGGNLAAVAAQHLADAMRIACQVLIYPVVDSDLTRGSYERYACGSILSAADMRWFWNAYTPDQAERVVPLASPLRGPIARGLAPAVMVAAEIDPLFDEGREYRKLLEFHGIPVARRVFAGMAHGFVPMIGLVDQSDEAISFINEEISKFI